MAGITHKVLPIDRSGHYILTHDDWIDPDAHEGDFRGSLGASAWVVANNAPTSIKDFAKVLQNSGYPVWVCDGVDDHIEINAAIATCYSVELTEGTFNITASIDVSKTPGYSRLTLKGQGQSTILATPGLADHFITTSIVTQRNMFITLRDFQILGTNQTGGNHGMYLWAGAHSRISNVDISLCDGSAIYLDADVTWTANNLWISHCRLNQNGGYGIYDGSGYYTDNWFYANEIYNNGAYGIRAFGGSTKIFSGRISTNTGYGIYVNGYWCTIHDVDISSNTNGILVGGGGDFLILYGNQIKNHTTGLNFNAGCLNAQAYGNYFDNNTTDVVNNGTNCRVHHNQGYITENKGSSTGTGAQQTIAHGLSYTPTAADIILWNIENGANPYHSAAPDATNIFVTAVINQDWGWASA